MSVRHNHGKPRPPPAAAHRAQVVCTQRGAHDSTLLVAAMSRAGLYAGLIVVAGVVCYSNGLSGPFVLDDRTALTNQGTALARAGRFDEAVTTFRQALDLGPTM